MAGCGGPVYSSAVRRGQSGGAGVPASTQAAWRAAPRATYSSGSGTATGTPKMPGATARTAG
jgi:hypothetical protein